MDQNELSSPNNTIAYCFPGAILKGEKETRRKRGEGNEREWGTQRWTGWGVRERKREMKDEKEEEPVTENRESQQLPENIKR